MSVVINDQGNLSIIQEMLYFGSHIGGSIVLGLFIAIVATKKAGQDFSGFYKTTFAIIWFITMIIPNIFGIIFSWHQSIVDKTITLGLNERWENGIIIGQIAFYIIGLLIFLFKTPDQLTYNDWGVKKTYAVSAVLLPLIVSVALIVFIEVGKGGIKFREQFSIPQQQLPNIIPNKLIKQNNKLHIQDEEKLLELLEQQYDTNRYAKMQFGYST